MLRRHARPVFGRQLAAALSAPTGDAALTLWRTPSAPFDEGEEVELSWPAFFDVLATRRPFRGWMSQPGFSAATFAPAIRLTTNVRSVSALVCVFPRAAGVPIGAFVAAWRDHDGFVFTSAEHSSSAHAFVAVLPYVRLVSLDEHRGAVEALAVQARREGRPFDAGARNAARFVYFTGAVPGRPFEAHALAGPMLIAPR